jgi:hypothetical protein
LLEHHTHTKNQHCPGGALENGAKNANAKIARFQKPLLVLIRCKKVTAESTDIFPF